MLKRLKIENFKTWSKADLTFGKITGLFGTNSSGKSSLIQFLLMLKQTKEATDRAIALNFNGQYANLGVFKDVIHLHDEEKTLSWSLKFDFASELVLKDAGAEGSPEIAHGRTISVSSGVHQRGRLKDIATTHLEYKFGNMKFALAPRSGPESALLLSAEGSNFRFIRTPRRAWPITRPVKSYAFPDQARTYFQNASFLADLERAYETQIDTLFYLGPLREQPHRDYLWSRTRPTDVGIKGEKTVEAILAARFEGEKRNRIAGGRLQPFEAMISYWLAQMGFIHAFKIEEIAKDSDRWQAKVITREGGPEALLTDVGFGVSQVLPVVTLLQYVPKGSTVILEQPEIHLHPSSQENLADVIINAALHRGVQVILESHSEHLLLRLQRRIAEGDFSSEDLKLYFCESKRGESVVEPLDVDILGQINNWPEKFMGDAFGETAKAEIARLRRTKVAAE